MRNSPKVFTLLPYLVMFLAGQTAVFPAEDSAESFAAPVAEYTKGRAGGLALFLGVSDAQGLAKFADKTNFYVQSVLSEQQQANQLRESIAALPSSEQVSAVWRRTQHLPYLDNLADAIVASGWDTSDYKGMTVAEIVRVLSPDGVALIGSDTGSDVTGLLAEAGKAKFAKAERWSRSGAWIRIIKQRDPDFGEWSSIAGGPEMTMVSNDKVLKPGKEIRWLNGPDWNTRASVSNPVIAGGREFYRESVFIRPDPKNPSYFVGQWMLVARNAYNGCDLWREKIDGSRNAFCADETRVYCSEGPDLIGRDAATGKVLTNYGPGIQHAASLGQFLLLYSGGAMVVEKDSGKVRWKKGSLAPAASKDGVVYLLQDDGVEAVQVADGKSVWKSPVPEVKEVGSGTIMCKGTNVYIVQGIGEGFRFGNGPRKFRVIALDLASGKVLWHDMRDRGYSMLPFDDVVWLTTRVPDPKFVNVNLHTLLDAKTGKEIKSVRGTIRMGSHCWGPRATERFAFFDMNLLVDRQSVETFSREGIRASCGWGQFPAYGMEYDLSHCCNCGVSLRGSAALSGGSNLPKGEVVPALVRLGGVTAGGVAGSSDWPMYRSDAARSNAYMGELPATLKKRWAAKVGNGSILQATGAGNLVLATDGEGHRVVALHAETGKQLWSFSAEGRISIPPTFHKGACLFSDHAGWVYCLDAATGKLAWQMQAAPEQRYMSAYNQFESSWPVMSGVLIMGDTAFFAAGRISPMEGGLFVHGVDALSGENRWKRTIEGICPTDLMLSDGKLLHFAGMRLNPSDGTDNRSAIDKKDLRILQIGTFVTGRISILDMLEAGKDPLQSRDMKTLPNDGRASGQMLTFDKNQSIASWRCRGGVKGTSKMDDGHCHLYSKGTPEWTNKDTAQQMMGLVLAGTRVYGVGIPEVRESKERPKLWVFAADTGKDTQRIDLESEPSLDGLSAIGGKVYVATKDGQLLCFDGQ